MILIDHQPLQFAGVQNIDRTLLVNNVVGLAKTAKVFGVPTILTTVLEERGGYLLKDIQDVFPDQKPINRTTLNTWEDERVVNVVKKIGRNGAGRRGSSHMDRIRKRAATRLGAGKDDSRNRRNHVATRRQRRHESLLGASTAGIQSTKSSA
jgi:hypothetical protein